jgi:hypothetical protein
VVVRNVKRVATAMATFLIVALWQAPAFALDGYEETVAGSPTGTQADLGCDPDKLEQIRRSWGIACFFQYGDDFWISDQAEDGFSVGVQWKLTDGSRSGLIRDKLGYHVSSMRYKDFDEGTIMKWRVGRCNGSSTNDCHQASDYVDWGTGTSAEAFCLPVAYTTDWHKSYFCSWP